MPPDALTIAVCLLALSFLLTGAAIAGKVRRFNRLYRKLGRQWDWRPVTSLRSFPRLEFQHRGQQAVLSGRFGTRYFAGITSLSLRPAEARDIRLAVTPRSALPIPVWGGTALIEGDDPDFSARFRAAGRPLDTARRLLEPAARSDLLHLQRIAPRARLNLLLTPSNFVVSLSTVLETTEDLIPFAEHSLALLDRFDKAVSSLDHILFLPDPAPGEDPVCPVCGEAVTAQGVACRRCRTPHHRDCWAFNRVCAVFGCGGRRYRKLKG